MKKNWYIVYTKPHCEIKVVTLLSKKKIENYCPLNKIIGSHINNKKTIYEPLFPCFVFVHAYDSEMSLILQVSSILTFVYWLGKPVVIKDEEIENIQFFTKENYNIKLKKVIVNASLNVRIISEPLVDMNSNTTSVEKSSLRMLLPSLGYIMMSEIEKATIDVFNYGFEISTMYS